MYRPIPLDPSQTVCSEMASQDDDGEVLFWCAFNFHFVSEILNTILSDFQVFGLKCDMRQRRINAPAVKRAIAKILSTKEVL